jgi:hypothetical protein
MLDGLGSSHPEFGAYPSGVSYKARLLTFSTNIRRGLGGAVTIVDTTVKSFIEEISRTKKESISGK